MVPKNQNLVKICHKKEPYYKGINSCTLYNTSVHLDKCLGSLRGVVNKLDLSLI